MFSKKSLKLFLITAAIVISLIVGTISLISMTMPNTDYNYDSSWWDDLDTDGYVDDDEGKCPYGKGKCACEDEDEYQPAGTAPVPHGRWYTPLTNSDGWLGEGFGAQWGVPLGHGTTVSHIFSENGLKMWINENSFNYYPALFHAICCREAVYVDWNLPVNFHIDTTQASNHITAWAEAVFNVYCERFGYTKINFDQVMAHVTENGLDERMNPLRPNQGYYKGSITLRDALRFIIDESVGDAEPEVRNRRDAATIYNAFLANEGALRLIQTRVYIFAPDFTNDPNFDNAPHFEVWPTYFKQSNFALIHEFSFGTTTDRASSEQLWCWHC